jgi:hypothetical protein
MNGQTFTGMGGHHSAKPQTEEWLTPPEIIDALGGAASFDLDPCAPAAQPWPTARATYTITDNGLLRPWLGRIWLNPPYSTDKITRWLTRLAEHGCGVALIFARTETDAFFRSVWDKSSALLFLRGRLNFHHADGRRAKANSGAPSVLCAYGEGDADVLAQCRLAGKFVPLLVPRSFVEIARPTTWMTLIELWFGQHDGPVALDRIYRDLAQHPKARRNPNFKAKIRQQLQQGNFRRTDRGKWEFVGEAAA